MMQISVKKGYSLNIAGQPEKEIAEIRTPEKIAVLPEHIPFIKPRLKVSEGDHVQIGTPLFEDKRNPDLIFLSPGAGVVDEINYGKRRVIQEIIIELDQDESEESFTSKSLEEINEIPRDEIIDLLMKGGLWPLVRELPFRDIADRRKKPPSIIVSLDSADNFQPAPENYLKGNEDLFHFGLYVLKKLSETVIVASGNDINLSSDIQGEITHKVKGDYPSCDPGVILYHTKKSVEENAAWYINGQDLLLIASLVKNGKYPVKKIFAVSGNSARVKKHVKARIGSPVSFMAGHTHETSKGLRYIAGGVLSGYTLPDTSYMGFYESSLTIIPEGNHEEFLGFLRPGYKRQSYSRTFLSFFNRSKIEMSCTLHGDLRACINCGSCQEICPVDILPDYTMKCLYADEIEDALAHGLLDCVECGLCTYVCPSKIELNQIMKQAKAKYYKERA